MVDVMITNSSIISTSKELTEIGNLKVSSECTGVCSTLYLTKDFWYDIPIQEIDSIVYSMAWLDPKVFTSKPASIKVNTSYALLPACIYKDPMYNNTYQAPLFFFMYRTTSGAAECTIMLTEIGLTTVGEKIRVDNAMGTPWYICQTTPVGAGDLDVSLTARAYM